MISQGVFEAFQLSKTRNSAIRNLQSEIEQSPHLLILLLTSPDHPIYLFSSPILISLSPYLVISKVVEKWRLRPDRLIIDRKIMKRGSYFAVHHGKSADDNGDYGRRFGEDEILILKKP